MELYQTNNPVPSNDPRDLDDNSKIIDRTVTGTEKVVYDRLAQPRFTLQALHSLVLDAKDEVAPTVSDAKQAVTSARDAGVSDINQSVKSVTDIADSAEAQMLQTAAELGDDLNNKQYDSYAEMLSDPQKRESVTGIVIGDADQNLDGWYKWDNTAKKWVRFSDQPVMERFFRSAVSEVDSAPSSAIPVCVSKDGKVGIWFDADGNFDAKGLQETAVRKVISKLSGLKPIAPIVVGADGKIALWLDDEGRLSAKGISPGALKAYITKSKAVQGNVPIAVDSTGRVALWLDSDGSLCAKGISSKLLKGKFAPRESKYDTVAPLATDGRTLYKWRSKLSRLETSQAGTKIRLGIISDSWGELPAIPKAIRNLLSTKFQKSSDGFVSAGPTGVVDGTTTYSYSSGWTLIDGSEVDLSGKAAGPDGYARVSTANNASMSLTTESASAISIYYGDLTGSFRYRLDGGEWTVVSSGSVASLTGLSAGPHTVEIDTAGNTGSVTLCGFYIDSAKDGYQVNRMGNGSSRSKRLLGYVDNVARYVAPMDLDLVLVILGTNDQVVNDSRPDVFISALQAVVTQVKSVTPNAGFIFAIPAQTNPTFSIVTPLYKYRDAMYEWCIAEGHEFFNLHDDFGSYSAENALGMFADRVHLNDAGAHALVRSLNRKLLNI